MQMEREREIEFEREGELIDIYPHFHYPPNGQLLYSWQALYNEYIKSYSTIMQRHAF